LKEATNTDHVDKADRQFWYGKFTMSRSPEYFKRKDAIAHIFLQEDVFYRLVQAGELKHHIRNGMECKEWAQLDELRFAIERPERKERGVSRFMRVSPSGTLRV